jgi:regulatory protein YycI of two-component signal transduction system YycFG
MASNKKEKENIRRGNENIRRILNKDEISSDRIREERTKGISEKMTYMMNILSQWEVEALRKFMLLR